MTNHIKVTRYPVQIGAWEMMGFVDSEGHSYVSAVELLETAQGFHIHNNTSRDIKRLLGGDLIGVQLPKLRGGHVGQYEVDMQNSIVNRHTSRDLKALLGKGFQTVNY